jgi:hypothetical protein
MNRKATLVVSLLALVVLFVLATSASAQNQPKFMVRDTEVDIGNFYEGSDIEYAFTVRNTGAGELHILSVRPG